MNIPTINLEVMLAGWTQTHNGGSKVTFWINDEDLEHFRHLTVKKGHAAGQRFMAVFVEIDDEGLPKDRDKPKTHPMVQSAGMLCSTEQFQRFAASYERTPAGVNAADHAADVIRRFCEIDSRAKLGIDEQAQRKFVRLMSIYREWQDANG